MPTASSKPFAANRFAQHAFFWAVYWFVLTFTYSRYDGDWLKTAVSEACQMPPRMLATYVSFWVLNRQRGTLATFLGIAAAVFAGGLLDRLIKMAYIVPVWYPEASFDFWGYRFMVDVFDCAFSAGIAVSARLYFRQQDFLRRENALRTEKSAAELLALKNQLHPHFLFNTINNLYALARMKSDKTAPVALQLAGLLRYVLYESAAETVPLEREISMLRDYLTLEKLRFDDERLSLNFETEMDNGRQPIAPLLLLPLVENAFKHGASESSDEAWVNIHISLKNKQLEAKIENAAPPETLPGNSGIGLKNLRRRLELIYPERHEFSIENSGEAFRVALKIDLS